MVCALLASASVYATLVVPDAAQASSPAYSLATVGPYGGYQAIKYENGVYYGASESRKDGQAAGY